MQNPTYAECDVALTRSAISVSDAGAGSADLRSCFLRGLDAPVGLSLSARRGREREKIGVGVHSVDAASLHRGKIVPARRQRRGSPDLYVTCEIVAAGHQDDYLGLSVYNFLPFDGDGQSSAFAAQVSIAAPPTRRTIS